MRQLAAELGVSPMTPYRSFEDKDDILAAVRANGFNRFAEALETARSETVGDARVRGSAVGEAYVTFALDNPHAYKLMFDFNQPHVEKYPELVAAGRRAQKTMTGHVEDALAEGLMEGDAEQIGLMFWAAIHGAVILELAGMLPPGGARQLYRGLDPTLMRGMRPED
jgi:AcrR family transcriptional regulator